MAPGGTVTDGPQVTVGGLTVIDVRSRDQAHRWAAKWTATRRCGHEVWKLGHDPKIDATLRKPWHAAVPDLDPLPQRDARTGVVSATSAMGGITASV